MKKLFAFLVMSLAVLVATVTNVQAQKVSAISTNFDGKYGKTKVTTDSTLTYIDSVNIATNEAGLVEVSVIGYAKDTAYSVTGVRKVRYNKRRGTLTMGSVIDEQAPVTDAALGTATFTLVAASNKIYVQVKGKDATNITWYASLRRYATVYR